MAAKKNFDKITTGKLQGAAVQATSRRGLQVPATEKEATERAAQLKTQGRKGCKAVRINMAFTPENHEFIQTMARVTNKSMTEFANFVVEKYRTEHPDLFEQAKDIISKL